MISEIDLKVEFDARNGSSPKCKRSIRVVTELELKFSHTTISQENNLHAFFIWRAGQIDYSELPSYYFAISVKKFQ